jgi:hypothetical protein
MLHEETGGMRRTPLRGLDRVGGSLTLPAAAYYLLRLPKLLAATDWGARTPAPSARKQPAKSTNCPQSQACSDNFPQPARGLSAKAASPDTGRPKS